eukprot:6625552-Prymnesium_polylepis.2
MDGAREEAVLARLVGDKSCDNDDRLDKHERIRKEDGHRQWPRRLRELHDGPIRTLCDRRRSASANSEDNVFRAVCPCTWERGPLSPIARHTHTFCREWQVRRVYGRVTHT